MNPRLTKEYRALRLPWLVGLAASLAMLHHRTQDYAIVAWVGCVALLAAMSIGNEFQQHTFSLLLSQPRARRDLWREKLLILAALAGTAGLMLFVSWGIAGSEHSDAHDMVMTGIFCLAVVCSAPLWTLVARSIIGGMVFSLAGALLLLLLTVELGVDRILGPRLTNVIPDSVYAWAWLITGLVYSGVCLLAGWRKFARMELKDANSGESALLSTSATHKARWWNWLRIRPGSGVRNLVRKEMRLQRPVVVVAAVFSLCWLAAVGPLHPFGPRHDYAQLFCLILAVVYIGLALALAGSISLGEERALGLAAWHLTLPVSARLQWLVKFAVGICFAIVLGLVLPGLLALATLPEARAGLADIASHGSASDMQGLLADGIVLWLFFVLSFWAATLLGNTMRAVFTAVLAVGALVLCTLLSGWLAEQIGGLEKGLLCEITSRWQLPLGFFHGDEVLPWEAIGGGLILSLVALAQSAVQFRRAQVQRAVVVKCAASLLGIAFLAAFWCVDFTVSARRGYDAVLVQEVSRALRALPYTQRGHSGSTRAVRITEMDMEKVFPLSARAKRWLSGAGLYSSWFELESRQKLGRMERHSAVQIKFPNGNECSFDYEIRREGP
jgi:hypothetical protein